MILSHHDSTKYHVLTVLRVYVLYTPGCQSGCYIKFMFVLCLLYSKRTFLAVMANSDDVLLLQAAEEAPTDADLPPYVGKRNQ